MILAGIQADRKTDPVNSSLDVIIIIAFMNVQRRCYMVSSRSRQMQIIGAADIIKRCVGLCARVL